MPQGSWREFNQDATAQPERSKSFLDKAELNVRVQKTRGGKGGKTVTVISGLKLDEADRRSLLKRLKARCGAGGTARGNLLELQGDQVAVLIEFLKKEGYCPKKSGG